MVLSLVIPLLQNDPSMNTDYIEESLGTVVYIGYFIGALMSGHIGDRMGRKSPIIYSNILMFTLGLLSAFPANIVVFILVRGLFGIVVGFFSPLIITLLVEITPTNVRGKFMMLFWVFYSLGGLITIFIAMIVLDSLEHGNWHLLLAWSSVPAFIAWIGSIYFLDESPRHQLVLGHITNAFDILEKMGHENNPESTKPLLTQDEKSALTQEFSNISKPINNDLNFIDSIKQLLSPNLKQTTLIVWYQWFSNVLIYYGTIYILPLTLTKLHMMTPYENIIGANEDNAVKISDLIFPSLVEVPPAILAAFLIDRKDFGRKNTLIIFFVVNGICCLFASLMISPGFIFWISCGKFCMNLLFNIIYQYTSELYPTKCRATGVAIGTSVGRIGSILMPTLCTYTGRIFVLLPFAIFGILSLLGGIITSFIKYDTTGVSISNIDKELRKN